MTDISPETERLLESEPLLAFLATSREGRPHVAPVWYCYGEGIVEVVTTGRKLANLRANPYASLAVQKSEGGLPAWTVTLLGRAEVVDDESETAAANRRINEKYGVDRDAWAENTLVRIAVGSASHRNY